MSFLIFVLGCILKRQCSRLFLQYEDQRYYFRVRVHKIAAISCKPLIDISTIMLKINLMDIFKVLKNSELLFFFISYTRPRTLLIIRLSVRRFSRYPQKMQFECSRFHIAWQKSCCAFVVVFSLGLGLGLGLGFHLNLQVNPRSSPLIWHSPRFLLTRIILAITSRYLISSVTLMATTSDLPALRIPREESSPTQFILWTILQEVRANLPVPIRSTMSRRARTHVSWRHLSGECQTINTPSLQPQIKSSPYPSTSRQSSPLRLINSIYPQTPHRRHLFTITFVVSQNFYNHLRLFTILLITT